MRKESKHKKSPPGDYKPQSELKSPAGDYKPWPHIVPTAADPGSQVKSRDTSKSLSGDSKPRSEERPPTSREIPPPPLSTDPFAEQPLVNQEVAALDNKREQRREKRQKVGRGKEKVRDGPTTKVAESRRHRQDEAAPRREDGKALDYSGVWKVKSSDGNPAKAIREVPVELVQVESGGTRKQRAAEERNADRIKEANKKDEVLLSEYLPTEIKDMLPRPIEGPDDSFEPGERLLDILSKIARTKTIPPKPAPVMFATTPEAIAANDRLLEEHGYDLESLVASSQDTTLGYGSEFRPIDQLEQVLGGHPEFEALRRFLKDGMDYRFKEEITEGERQCEVEGMLERGNHKSTEKGADKAAELLAKDVAHGFSIPVSPDVVRRIKGAMVQPLGLATQFTLAEDGSRKIKSRLTQDLSFSLTEQNMSVNSRIDMDQYPEMFYGWCISRIIHFIVSLRLAHPQGKIFISKYDYSDAYRRMAHSATAAAKSIAVLASVAYIAIRLTFGGSPNPPSWCLFSEMVTDLANEIACCSEYDPDLLKSPAQPRTPAPKLSTDEAPLAIACALAVRIPVKHTARVDCFIDDLINCFLDTESNRSRQPHVVPLAMHCTSRPHAGASEPITRRDILSGPKLIAEGTPAETQIVLGWVLDTHHLLIRLPDDKYDAWLQDLQEIRAKGVITYAKVDSLTGKLNHVAFLIPLARHFLTRFRALIDRSRPQEQQVTVSRQLALDAELWERFLLKAHQGISMNRVTIRQPTKLAVSDSCPFGIGGFLLDGRAWRVRIPKSSPIYGQSTVNNFLEFLGMVVNVWLMCSTFTEESEALLAVGDNTSAIGWMFRSSKVPKESLYYAALQMGARKLATLVIDSKHCLASQHTKGQANLVADLLSWSGDVRGAPHPLASDDPSDAELTLRFHSHLPQLIPATFEISPLPNDILSWVTLALQTVESSWIQNRKRDTKPATEFGDDGSITVPSPETLTTRTSLRYPTTPSTSSFEPSSASIDGLNGVSQADWKDDIKSHWSQALSALPQAVWLRRFGTISNQVPFTSRGAKTCILQSKPSSRPSKM
jgi:hypothetical protein